MLIGPLLFFLIHDVTLDSNTEKKILRLIGTKLQKINLFDSYSNEPSMERRERRMTRIYILLMLVVSIVLLFYTSIQKTTNLYTIYDVTESTIEKLFATHPDSIQCPCRSYSMHYNTFITVKLSFHQICSSQFISQEFIQQFWRLNTTVSDPTDFLRISGSYFSSIASMCQMFQNFALYLLDRFHKSLFTTANLLSRSDFESEVNKLLRTFKNRMSDSSTVLHDHVFDGQTLYQPLDVAMSSFNLRLATGRNILIEPITFDSCSCILESRTCSQQASLYTYNSTNDSFTYVMKVNGINVSCSPFQSALHSNLGCWYSEECYQHVSYTDSFH